MKRATLLLPFLLLAGSVLPLTPGRAAISAYADRGKADFDVVLDILNPLGTWTNAAIKDGKPFFRPYDAAVPFTQGRWEYSDFGWLWIGTTPGSWGTEHYGWWTLDAPTTNTSEGAKWSWHPDGTWHPVPVDFRQTKDSIGWRASRLDEAGEFVEKESDRYAKPEEWIWVPVAKFLSPLTAKDLIIGASSPAAAEQSKNLLLDSQAATHIYSAWREIERTGPDPAKILPPARVVAEENRAPNQPNVTPYILMNLPSAWAPLPPTAQPTQIYLYRPAFYQDIDGVRRRIAKWYAPAPTDAEKAQISQIKQSLQEQAEAADRAAAAKAGDEKK
ncbi:hypothetical protein SAMN05444156_3182 [Verrucomicrobium sp. GAS474]|uniref:DUF6600 domain-containing protein n=1 Tax=Verrucomicrobium sp. GAS474 TaxID=1882831 RepID=UPI00087D6891|nr:DUF6600 domain-containing protein [Verrucomicrobium sp. GAS474]SDU30462.1 hypothetical protein SAMN05444156_3182 [Verrucomicrobium sp. GAS474]